MRIVIVLSIVVLLVSGSSVLASASFLEFYPVDGLTKVCVNQSGVKWFGTATSDGGEVLCFDEARWQAYGPVGWVTALEVDPAGLVWAGTYDDVYWIEGGQANQLRQHDFDFPMFALITGIGFDSQGSLWAGSWNGWPLVSCYVLGPNWRQGQGLLSSRDDWCSDSNEVAWAFAIAPDGSFWLISRYRVFRVIPGEGTFGLESFQTGASYHTDLAILSDGQFWLTARSSPPEAPWDVMRSDDGRSWDPVEHPCVPGKTGFALCLEPDGPRGLWFGCVDPFWLGGGAFWYDYTDWRWLDFGRTIVNDIAVDGASGDVWFATSDGAYVLRGGPDAWPPVWIELTTQEPETKAGKSPSQVTVQADVWFQMDLNLDVYVAVQDGMGNLYFAPGFGGTMAPMAAGVNVPIGLTLENFTVLTLDLANVPAGTYRWFAACTNTGTMEFASNIASCEWNFSK